MTWSAATWLAFRGGRSDRLRIVLTVASTALAAVLVILAGAVVTPPGPRRGPYANPVLWTEDGLRGGTVLALVLLCLPFVAFAAQCARVGHPARERRFEDLARLGATPGELRRVTAVESGIAAVAGVLLGLPLYGLLVLIVGSIGAPVPVTSDGSLVPTRTEWFPDSLLLPTDRVPTWWVVVPGLVLLPLLVVQVAVLGAARRARSGSVSGEPRAVLGRSVVLVVGSLAVAAFTGWGVRLLPYTVAALFLALGMLIAAVAFGVGAAGLAGGLGVALGARLASRSRRPEVLLAGRRMAGQHRRAASRLTLLLGCLIGGATLVLRADALAMAERQGDIAGFFGQTYALVILGLGLATAMSALGLLVAEVEGVVEGRRSLATAVAAGVPRAVLARAVVLEAVLPVVPAVLVTTLVGALVAWRFAVVGSEVTVDVPWVSLAVFVGGVSLAAVLAATLATLALPASTDVSETRVPA